MSLSGEKQIKDSVSSLDEKGDTVPSVFLWGKKQLTCTDKWLGRGGYGTCMLALDNEGRHFVVKVLKVDATTRQKAQFLEEIRIQENVCHVNIVRVYGGFRWGERLSCVMEYCSGGNLSTYLKKHTKLGVNATWHIIADVSAALVYLKKHRIVHRDIKPGNMLLVVDANSPRGTCCRFGNPEVCASPCKSPLFDGRVTSGTPSAFSLQDRDRAPGQLVKLCDFGMSIMIEPDEMCQGVSGTPHYMSPEVIGREPHDWQTDVWGLGVTCFRCFTGFLPFDGCCKYMIYELIKKGKWEWPGESDKGGNLQKCIEGMLTLCQFDRVTADELSKRSRCSPSLLF